MKKTINLLESLIIDPTKGLPEEIFLFATRITPMINVDLLIKNKKNQTLLTWRDDGYDPAGWHIPGGIIRCKEKISKRIEAVAKTELGANVKSDHILLALNECIHPTRQTRGHGIALLYACTLTSPLDKRLEYKKGTPKPGEWAWHNKCPKDIIPLHKMYIEFLKRS